MKHKLIAVSLSALMVLSTAWLAACGNETNPPDGDNPGGGGNQLSEYVLPTYSDRTTKKVSVHDPSIFFDPNTKTYYAFGSHFAVASSTDLITWKQEVRDEQPEELYGEEKYGIWPKAIEDTVKLVKPAGDIKTTWAPDVEFYNGKYYMYYSLTRAFGSDRSAIARVESDNVLGPYTNNTAIVDSVSATGAYPNCIDPELFYDKDGKLWMVYGSFFGGIYIKELNNSGDNWGLPKEEGFGKLLWKNGATDEKGNLLGVEGPFVFYNETTDYYYLMVSEGDLNTVYNMRIARSKTPDGPYKDITDNDVSTDEGKGNKIAGNYQFQRAGKQPGYAALGHNSVIKDKDGRYFVVYHTRRQTGSTVTKGHNLCVSQMFFNEQGWPVMAPNCYVGEQLGIVTQAQAAGMYEVVVHSAVTKVDMVVSEEYKFNADGTVQKGTEAAGSWTVKENYYVEITLGETVYRGVIAPGWDMYSAEEDQEGVLSISAVSDTGVSFWAIAN